MKLLTLILVITLSPVHYLLAENRSEQSPMTMEQLMQELRIQGGNFVFTFDKPAYARVRTHVGDDKKMEKEEFLTDKAQQEIKLFFNVSALFVGDYPQPKTVFTKKMMINLSGCEATWGTRIVHYADVLKGNHSEFKPAIPPVIEFKKEYILNHYFQSGNPYEAKATIEFSEVSFEAGK